MFLEVALEPPQLLLRREQAAGAERTRPSVAVSDTAASSMNITTTCRRTASSGLAPARIMPVIAPGRKTMPIVLVLSMTGTMARRTDPPHEALGALARATRPGPGPPRSAAAVPRASSSSRTAVTEATFMLLPTIMPAMGIT